MAFGCGPDLNKRVTLWRNDKIPYGAYYAYNELKYIFDVAEINIIKNSPAVYTSLHSVFIEHSGNDSSGSAADPRSAYLVLSPAMKPDAEEIRALFRYVAEGQQVFISSLEVGKNLLDSLRLSTAYGSTITNFNDSLRVSLLHPVNGDSSSYCYPGRAMDNYFLGMDSTITTILGKDEQGRANFVKFSYNGGGALYIHLAPAAFTNFFLLHKNNKQYYDQALSNLPAGIKKIYWDDYYRGKTNENEDFSKLKIFLNDRILSWAFWLTILLFSLIYLFESKRKQHVIPPIKSLTNSSLDFVKTIGSLYYQRKDNKNLAEKMIIHFLDHIRTRFNLTTSQLTAGFEDRLALKSGYDIVLVKEIMLQMRMIEQQATVTDETLLSFNEKLDKFYKHT